MTGFAKRDLIHASNFVTLRMCNSAHNFEIWYLAFPIIVVIHDIIAHSQMKLCLFKVAKLDACIRALFANPVTYTVLQHIYSSESGSIITLRFLIAGGGFEQLYCDILEPCAKLLAYIR